MKNYTNQYKVLFCLSWIFLYFFFPVWRFIHFEDIYLSKSQTLLITIMYFSISIYLTNRYLNAFTIGKPLFIKITDWFEHIKNNSGLVMVCFLSLVLHIYPLSLDLITIGGGEVPYLRNPAWVYDFFNKYWHRLFDFPIEYLYWSLIVLLILIIKQKKMINSIWNYFKENKSSRYIFISSVIIFMYMYSYFFPYFTENPGGIVRLPPVSKYLYLIIYYTFGISYTGPRVLQFIFYILSAVYLYRTILMFNKKETALLGATIYLFSPLIFSHASLAMLASGKLFFIILISFYFLRFLKDEDNRDLVLTTYFIGLGFMYKRVVLLMFIICFTYLLLKRIKKMDWRSTIHFKVLLLSLIPVVPWLLIGPSHFVPLWHRLISFDGLTLYTIMIHYQMSLIILSLFIVSIVFVCFTKKDKIHLFYGAVFVAYYLFFTITKNSEINHRYAATLYPTIAVFIAHLIFSIAQKIRWKHTFKLFSSVLAIYLIVLCVIPRSSSSLTTYKYRHHEIQYFPVEEATDWIMNKTGKAERVIRIFLPGYGIYLKRFYENRNVFDQNKFAYVNFKEAYNSIDPIEALKKQCLRENITYVMFAYGPNNILTPNETFINMLKKMKYTYENIGREFNKAAEFNIDDNYIFIYKLKPELSDA